MYNQSINISKRRNFRRDWAMCIFIMLFIFCPILSTQPDAHPGALYVLAIVTPVFVMAINAGIIKPTVFNVYAVLLFVFALFSTLVSDLGGFNVRTILKYFVFILFYISTSTFVLRPKQLFFCFKSYLYLSIALAVLIVLSYIFGFPHIEATGSQGRYSIGITGVFKNPNYLTSFYNIAFFVIAYILATIQLQLKKRIILYLIIALFLVASFFSGTRAALVIELLVLAAMPLLMARKGRLYRIIPLVLIVASVIAYNWESLVDLYDLFVGTRDLIGDTGREDAWKYAFSFIKEKPLFGCGHDSWSNICKGTSYLEYLHNIFLELLLDQGVVGLVLAAGMIVTGFKKVHHGDRVFLTLLLFVSAFPMLFQNGLYEVNFWRFIVINRLMMTVSKSYRRGVAGFMSYAFGLEHKRQWKAFRSNSNSRLVLGPSPDTSLVMIKQKQNML